jgi:hypothetical protein
MQTDKISVTNAQIIDLHNNERVLVGALGGYMITVYNVTMLVTYASSTESSSNNLYFGYDDSTDSSYWKYERDAMNGKTTDLTYSMTPYPPAGGTCTTSILNKPFVMWSNAAFNGGWSAEVYVTYAYTKVL